MPIYSHVSPASCIDNRHREQPVRFTERPVSRQFVVKYVRFLLRPSYPRGRTSMQGTGLVKNERCLGAWNSGHSVSQGLYSLSGRTYYRKISWSLEAARFGFKLVQSLWNLTGTSTAPLPRCLPNFRAMRLHYNTQSRGFKTSRDFALRRPTALANRSSVFYLWLNKVQANERRCYATNVFSHWLRPYSTKERKWIQFWPLWSMFGLWFYIKSGNNPK